MSINGDFVKIKFPPAGNSCDSSVTLKVDGVEGSSAGRLFSPAGNDD